MEIAGSKYSALKNKGVSKALEIQEANTWHKDNKDYVCQRNLPEILSDYVCVLTNSHGHCFGSDSHIWPIQNFIHVYLWMANAKY